MKNLSLIFNKVYYSKINTVKFDDLDSNEKYKKQEAVSELSADIERHNKQIYSVVFNRKTDYKGLSKSIAPHQVIMETKYPGLIIGSGNPHGAQLCDNDINSGFSFDYVSGQPYIPGSSVKGVLRSCFKDFPEAVTEILKQQFPHYTQGTAELEKEIFDGRDIFFDAVIYNGNASGRILDADYITPHPDETKDPNPILILKLLPDVRLMFAFKLYDGSLSADEKQHLFATLLSVFGIGAKTNTGYGRLTHIEDEDSIICEDCGKTHKLTAFEKDKIENAGWRITRCRECNLKRNQQKAGGQPNGKQERY